MPALRRVRQLLHATDGGGFVQILVLVGCVALAGIGAWAAFRKSVTDKVQDEGQHVIALEGYGPGKGNGTVCTGGVCVNGTSCFVAGTPIATPDGPRPIEEILAGDTVLSENEETGEVSAKPVVGTFVTPDRDVLDVYVHGHSAPIQATPGHLFFTRDRGWVPTEVLERNEPLTDAAGAIVAVDYVDPHASRARVYNFEVEETHTYFAGDARVLVHNPKQKPGTGGKLQPVPGSGPPDPETAAMLQGMGIPVPGTRYYIPQLPPNAAVVELSNDPSSLHDAQQYSAAHGVPVYFSYNLDPDTTVPPGAPAGGVVYEPVPGTNQVRPVNGGGTTAYIPGALAGKGTLVLGSHGWPGRVQWGGPMQSNYWGSQIDAATLVYRLQQAGYKPTAVDPGSHIYALPCNVCTNPVNGTSVAQTLSNGFNVSAEGLEATPGKNGLNAAGPVSEDTPPAQPHVPITNKLGDPKYLVPTLADDNGQYVTCTPDKPGH